MNENKLEMTNYEYPDKVTIVFGRDDDKQVPAMLYGQVAVHPGYIRLIRDYEGDPTWTVCHTWVVTHIRTGSSLATYTTEASAHEFAQEVSTKFDMDAMALALGKGSVTDQMNADMRYMLRRRGELPGFFYEKTTQMSPNEMHKRMMY